MFLPQAACQYTYKPQSLKSGIFLYFLCYFSPGWQNKCLQLSEGFGFPLLIKQIWNQLPELILVLFVEFPFCACRSVKSSSHFLSKRPGLWQAAGDITPHDDFSILKKKGCLCGEGGSGRGKQFLPWSFFHFKKKKDIYAEKEAGHQDMEILLVTRVFLSY